MAKLIGTLRSRLVLENEDFRRGLKSATQNVNTFEKSFSRLSKRIGGYLAVGAISAGLQRLVNDTANFADEIDKMSIRTGVARRDLQALQFVTDQLGVRFESVEGVLASFTRRIPDIEKGTSTAAEAFKRLNVRLRDSSGEMRGMGALFPDMVRGLTRIENETERNAIATQIFGRRALEIVPILAAGGDELERLTKRAEELGLVMSDADIARLVAFKDRWAEIKMQFAASGRELTTTLIPVLEGLAGSMDTLNRFVEESIKEWNVLLATILLIPAAMNAAQLALTGNVQGARDAMREAVAEWRKAIDEMSKGLPDPFSTSGLTTPIGDPDAAEGDGKTTARRYFDGLKSEWADLAHAISLRAISLDGTESQRLALEEQHALRLLDIEAERLALQKQRGEISASEFDVSLQEVQARREIVKARRREFEAVDEVLRKQRNLVALIDSASAVLPQTNSGPGSAIGSNAATVLADKYAKNWGDILGGFGSLIVPGIGGLIGGAIGSLFGGDEGQTPRVVSTLDAIQRNTKEAITAIEQQTADLLTPESRLVNAPASFSLPKFVGGEVSFRDINISVTAESNASPDDIASVIRDEVSSLLSGQSRSRSRGAR